MSFNPITSIFIGDSTGKEKSFPYFSFTIYSIKIITCNSSWIINRRYNQFRELDKKLKAIIHDIPFLPEKRFFCLKRTVLNERIIYLENYLNDVLQRVGKMVFTKIYEFLYDFLSLESLLDNKISSSYCSPHKFEMFMTSEDSIYVNSITSCDHSSLSSLNSTSQNYFSNINQFFKSSIEENNSNNCNEFLKFLTDIDFNLQINEIYFLFFGNNSYKGLVYLSGNLDKSPTFSSKCLNLLLNILSKKFNSNYLFYQIVFKKGKFEDIRNLNPNGYYRLKEFNSLQICFKIIKLYIQENVKAKNFELMW